MVISTIGLGYVGLTVAVGFALKGYNVIGIDKSSSKVESIGKGNCTIYDQGLKEALKKVTIRTTTSYEEIRNSDITFICVDTPSNVDGSMHLDEIEQATKALGKALRHKDGYHLVVIKSTVVPGTTESKIIPILEQYSSKLIGRDIGFCVAPEFLREGKLLEDFMNPARIIIGENDSRAGNVLCELYGDFRAQIMRTDLRTAEMIKHASNAFLATRISFINEIGNICKRLGIDVYEVRKGMALDPRIGDKYLDAGAGFGGSCLPKDIKALVAKAGELDYEASLLKSVIKLNREQPLRLVDILNRKVGKLSGKRIAVLGLAFKPNTDDVRESPAIPVIKKLLKGGAHVLAYDPVAMENMKKTFSSIEYKDSAKDALMGADACLIMTDWDEFRKLNEEFRLMSNKVIIEGRKVIRNSVEREGICW